MTALTRRGLLGVAGAALCTAPPLARAADAAPDSFMTLSAFLTGRDDLDARLGPRFLTALTRADGGFAAAMTALAQGVAGQGSMDAFIASTPNATLIKTATLIVSAWYLGVVGTGAAAELITYEDALMYRPTAGMAVIPSYCVGPSYWAAAPRSASN